MAEYTQFENEDGSLFWWKDCEIKGCVNQVCTWKSDRFCFPHSDSGETLETMMRKLTNKVREPELGVTAPGGENG